MVRFHDPLAENLKLSGSVTGGFGRVQEQVNAGCSKVALSRLSAACFCLFSGFACAVYISSRSTTSMALSHLPRRQALCHSSSRAGSATAIPAQTTYLLPNRVARRMHVSGAVLQHLCQASTACLPLLWC